MAILCAAGVNEQPLRGTAALGEESLQSLFTVAVCRIMCLKDRGWAVGLGSGGIGLQTHKWMALPPPQLTRPCTSSFV
ncbi:Hypothetical protein SMAX5B_012533 [Scophthalmus maximus]|uniref:Uncharacterized protein n=1 Tax=Scophthalmus maximus TaxID=52904 RepID=A0A2U9BBU6_SCOMX|nr:Hypothetical protein SMAX5B_012533 [Scophthalmus maximus]